MLLVPLGGLVSADEGPGPDDDHGPINLAIILHMHQPYYKNIETGFYELPWVRVHGSHEYIDSPGILGMYPGTNITYNVVPSLIEQLEDYALPSTPSPGAHCRRHRPKAGSGSTRTSSGIGPTRSGPWGIQSQTHQSP